MDIILVPGLWLDGDSWRHVVPGVEQAGHRAHPLTLPGMESSDADRSVITLRDHVEAVVSAVDAIDAARGGVVLVGHSAGCAIAYAAVDARPDRVAHLVCVGGFPLGDGLAIADDVPVEGADAPLPDWSTFDDGDLAGLDEAARASLRARAIPSPAQVVRGRQQLADERRHRVPVTAVCTEYSAETLRGWVDAGVDQVAELATIARVGYVDLPTGHWPQVTRPADLARIIVACAGLPAAGARIDEHGRVEPPDAAGDLETLVGFLEYQRATFAWKCTGVDEAGSRTTVGASDMTLGGLLKHMAYVEDNWFTRRISGHDRRPPWDAVDWDRDPDWEWHSAASDSPGELAALWYDAVEHSRRCLDEALARGGLDQLAAGYTMDDQRVPSVRWILTHMIEEYARHNGHADLIRESVDGQTGE